MKKLWHILPLLLLAGSFWASPGCVHEPLTPQAPGDTTGLPADTLPVSTGRPCSPETVYFEKQILPILLSNCAQGGCHDAASRADGVVLTSYAQVMQTGGIRPGRPADSEIIEAITDSDPDKRMPPPPASPLPASELALLETWIAQGAKNLACIEAAPCDTATVSYQQHVLPILQFRCIGCHNGPNAGGGVELNNHQRISEEALSGRLLGAIAHEAGFVAMPPSGAKLPDCEILKIKTWAARGAPNN